MTRQRSLPKVKSFGMKDFHPSGSVAQGLEACDQEFHPINAPAPAPVSARIETGVRARVKGKSLFLGDEKFYVRGVTYGAFPPNSNGYQFPEQAAVEKDLALMQAAGINTILTYTVPPLSLLDQVQDFAIRVIVVVPWMEYICFLEESKTRREIMRRVKEGVASCRRHPAVLMYCCG